MLTWINPSGFKSFGDDGDALEVGPLTLLVGANATGKSNLLELIRLFQGLAIGFPVIDVVQGVQRGGSEVWPGLRGGVAEMVHRGGNALRPQLGVHAAGEEWEYGIQMLRGESVNLVPDLWEEWLLNKTLGRGVMADDSANQTETFCYLDGEYNEGERDYFPDATSLDAARSNLLHLSASNRAHVDLDPTPVREFLARSRVLDLVPARMRNYSPRSARQLSNEGDNLSAILLKLMEFDGFKEDLVDWISELCAPRIADIDFVQVHETGDVLFQLIEDGGTRITAKSASDGTLRFLGLIAALWTLPRKSMVCLEEVERGLHPSRIDLLMELLVQVVREREIQLIATTHSPRVLHALGQIDREHLGNALVFGRPPGADGTLTRSLKDLPAFEDALQRRGIDQLFTMQWLEMAM